MAWPRTIALGLALSAVSCSSKDAAYNPDCDDLPGQIQGDLRCTGLYSDFASKTVSTDVTAYTPGLQLWSDGADKSRWLYLPPGSQIDTTDMDEWKFPNGTKVWKEFRLQGKRIETRFFYKQSTGQWIWTTFRWSDDESKAPALTTGEQNIMGTFEIPDQAGCDKCHRGRVDKLLGVEAISLGQSAAQGITLATLVADSRLSVPPAETQIAIPEDTTGKAAAALGYMHMNCGVSCHVRSSIAEGSASKLYQRLSATDLLKGGVQVKDVDAYKTAVNVLAAGNEHYEYVAKGYYLIKPGDSGLSLVPALAGLRDGKEQMPSIGSHVVDDQGLALITSWIDALPP